MCFPSLFTANIIFDTYKELAIKISGICLLHKSKPKEGAGKLLLSAQQPTVLRFCGLVGM